MEKRKLSEPFLSQGLNYCWLWVLIKNFIFDIFKLHIINTFDRQALLTTEYQTEVINNLLKTLCITFAPYMPDRLYIRLIFLLIILINIIHNLLKPCLAEIIFLCYQHNQQSVCV